MTHPNPGKDTREQARAELERVARLRAEAIACGYPLEGEWNKGLKDEITRELVNFVSAESSRARREGMEEAAGIVERRVETMMENPDIGYVEADTNAFVWTNCDAEWSAIQLGEAVDAIRRAAKGG